MRTTITDAMNNRAPICNSNRCVNVNLIVVYSECCAVILSAAASRLETGDDDDKEMMQSIGRSTQTTLKYVGGCHDLVV